MNTFLNKYFSDLEVKEASIPAAEKLRDSWLEGECVLHVPGWLLPGPGESEILVRRFAAIIFSQNGKIWLMDANGTREIAAADVFDTLYRMEQAAVESDISVEYFYCTLLAYELNGCLEKVEPAADFYQLPEFYLLLPADALIINNEKKSAFLFQAQGGLDLTPANGMPDVGQIRCSVNRNTYLKKIEAIRELIFEGEVYQINYTVRFSAAFSGNSYSFFRNLHKINPAPYSFYAALPHCQLISISPECFVTVSGNLVTTQPVKGTVRRGGTAQEDEERKRWLLESEKDAAELSMIVDLLRNDLSRVCKAGSVKVAAHKQLQTVANVHHLFSTISGRLDEGRNFVDVLKAAFPGGSITGCPKIAAMNYISGLEQTNRSFYTGVFGICFPARQLFHSSILIRTGIATNNQIHFQTGGGIVIDSDPEAEYQECLAKADSFFKAAGRSTNDFL